MRLTGRFVGYGSTVYGVAQVYGLRSSAAAQRFVPGKKKRKEEFEYQGPQQRFRTDEERHQRRIELGILPAPVKQAVEKAVRRVVNKAKAAERFQPQESVNPLIWLRQHHAQEQQALAYELRKRDLQFDLQYMALVRYEVARHAQAIQDADEEEQVIALLLDSM